MNLFRHTILPVIIALFSGHLTAQSTVDYIVSVKETKGSVPPALWGLFFEDINRGADGGMYAEMIENRSFDFPKPMTGWQTWPVRVRDGVFIVTSQLKENPANPKLMAVNLRAGDTVGLINAGFNGLAFKKDLPYDLTLRYRQNEPGIHVRAILFGTNNKILGRSEMELGIGHNWQEQMIKITPSDSSGSGKLLVIFEGAGSLDMDRISLFPTDTWKNRPGGLRKDLVQKLVDLKPGFLRFPGGCIVEGNQLVHRYQWKHTIGPLENRELVQSIWADDVPARQTPDYMESFGLGFYEYFQLCEDIAAAPLPILNCGMSCQFDAAEVVPLNELDPYIQDALDLIEFANGDPATTVWGRKRMDLGHAAPFNMKMLGVGNENWGPQYAERLELFTKAIKAKYPGIQLINATGYSRNIPVFTYMDSVLRARKADIIDEHFYDTPQWFMSNAGRYDSYDRKGPKIFVGEYAAQTDRIGSQKNVNNLLSALSEACFMTGIERNADIMAMASYAPLFAHVTDWQWTPNLIWFNNSSSYNTPNYYVQQLFSVNKGTDVVSITASPGPSSGGEIGKAPLSGQDSCWASAVINKASNELIIKMVNMSAQTKDKKINLTDGSVTGQATMTSLANHNTSILNSIENPDNIKPVTTNFPVKGKAFSMNLAPYSLNVIRIKIR